MSRHGHNHSDCVLKIEALQRQVDEHEESIDEIRHFLEDSKRPVHLELAAEDVDRIKRSIKVECGVNTPTNRINLMSFMMLLLNVGVSYCMNKLTYEFASAQCRQVILTLVGTVLFAKLRAESFSDENRKTINRVAIYVTKKWLHKIKELHTYSDALEEFYLSDEISNCLVKSIPSLAGTAPLHTMTM